MTISRRPTTVREARRKSHALQIYRPLVYLPFLPFSFSTYHARTCPRQALMLLSSNLASSTTIHTYTGLSHNLSFRVLSVDQSHLQVSMIESHYLALSMVQQDSSNILTHQVCLTRRSLIPTYAASELAETNDSTERYRDPPASPHHGALLSSKRYAHRPSVIY
jgi:hypothetical protein